MDECGYRTVDELLGLNSDDEHKSDNDHKSDDEHKSDDDNLVTNRDEECKPMLNVTEATTDVLGWINNKDKLDSAMNYMFDNSARIADNSAPILFASLVCLVHKFGRGCAERMGFALHKCFGGFDLWWIDAIYEGADAKVQNHDLLDSMLYMSRCCKEFVSFNKKAVETYLKGKMDARRQEKMRRVFPDAKDKAMLDYLSRLLNTVCERPDFTNLYMFLFDKAADLLCPEFKIPGDGNTNINSWSSLSHTLVKIMSLEKIHKACIDSRFFDSDRRKIVTIVHIQHATQDRINEVLSEKRLPAILKSLIDVDGQGVQRIIDIKLESLVRRPKSAREWFTDIYNECLSMVSIVAEMTKGTYSEEDEVDLDAYVKSFVPRVVEKLSANPNLTFTHNLIGELLLRCACAFQERVETFKYILVDGPHIERIMVLHGEERFRVRADTFGKLIRKHRALLGQLYTTN
jgi:hypothetical protein